MKLHLYFLIIVISGCHKHSVKTCEDSSDCNINSTIEITDFEKTVLGNKEEQIRYGSVVDTLSFFIHDEIIWIDERSNSCNCSPFQTVRYQVASQRYLSKENNLAFQLYTAVYS